MRTYRAFALGLVLMFSFTSGAAVVFKPRLDVHVQRTDLPDGKVLFEFCQEGECRAMGGGPILRADLERLVAEESDVGPRLAILNRLRSKDKLNLAVLMASLFGVGIDARFLAHGVPVSTMLLPLLIDATGLAVSGFSHFSILKQIQLQNKAILGAGTIKRVLSQSWPSKRTHFMKLAGEFDEALEAASKIICAGELTIAAPKIDSAQIVEKSNLPVPVNASTARRWTPFSGRALPAPSAADASPSSVTPTDAPSGARTGELQTRPRGSLSERLRGGARR